MEFSKHIFRAYDIRGLLAEVTPEIARSVGQALVSKTGAKTVIVGRDMRETSPELEQAAIEGVISMGANVIDIGLCSTSMFNFAVSSQPNVDAGLMVTASHNPPEFNGIKMAHANGLPISGTEILESMSKTPSSFEEGAGGGRSHGSVVEQNILPAYIDKCIAVANPPDLLGTKIVVDYGNGMGAMAVRELCKRLNVELIELYPEQDAHFPNHEANPAKEETLADVKAAVIRERADLASHSTGMRIVLRLSIMKETVCAEILHSHCLRRTCFRKILARRSLLHQIKVGQRLKRLCRTVACRTNVASVASSRSKRFNRKEPCSAEKSRVISFLKNSADSKRSIMRSFVFCLYGNDRIKRLPILFVTCERIRTAAR